MTSSCPPLSSASTSVGASPPTTSTTEQEISYNELYHLCRADFRDFLNKTLSLDPFEDVVVVDRAKYSGNVGSILRHMPIFAGSTLFLTHEESEGGASSNPPYTRHFLKETLRVGMAFSHQAVPNRLCIGGTLEEVLGFLRREDFHLLCLENAEVFEEVNFGKRAALSRLREHWGRTTGEDAAGQSGGEAGDHDSAGPTPTAAQHIEYSSVFEAGGAIGDFSRRLGFVFGGENGGLSKRAIRMCHSGAFIPSRAGCDTAGSTRDEGGGGGGVEEGEDRGNCQTSQQAGVPAPRARAHTCNLNVAATIVLSERFRRSLLVRGAKAVARKG